MSVQAGIAQAERRDAERSLPRAAALAGTAAPPVFAVGAALATWANLDFMRGLGWSLLDHGDSAWPSGLAQGPHGWIQVATFAATGLLLLVFVAGFRTALRGRRSGRTATALLVVLALGFLLAAFPEDGPPFGEPGTAIGTLHGLGFLALVLGSVAAPLATARALRGDERWQPVSALSVAAAIAAFVFMFVLVFALETATTLGVYGFLASILGWFALLAARLRDLPGDPFRRDDFSPSRES